MGPNHGDIEHPAAAEYRAAAGLGARAAAAASTGSGFGTVLIPRGVFMSCNSFADQILMAVNGMLLI